MLYFSLLLIMCLICYITRVHICMQKSFHYLGLLKNVMRLSMTSLKAADSKEVASSVTAVANEKLKAEKEAAAGKKKTGMSLSVHLLNLF